MRGKLAALAALLTLVAVPARAQALEPITEWQVRQEAESCRAFRVFGGNANPHLMQLRSFGPGSVVELTIGSNALPKDLYSGRELHVSWDGKEIQGRQLGLIGASGTLPTVTLQVDYREPTAALINSRFNNTMWYVSGIEPQAETFGISFVGIAPIVVHMGSLQAPLAMLRDCENGLMAKWGFGPEYLANLGKGPQLLKREVLQPVMFYPAVMLLRRVGEYLQLRLKVDKTGKVTDCVTQSSPANPVFATDGCATLRKTARFSPATNKAGQAIDGFAQVSMTFARFD